jgi:hypothetical protein
MDRCNNQLVTLILSLYNIYLIKSKDLTCKGRLPKRTISIPEILLYFKAVKLPPRVQNRYRFPSSSYLHREFFFYLTHNAGEPFTCLSYLVSFNHTPLPYGYLYSPFIQLSSFILYSLENASLPPTKTACTCNAVSNNTISAT